MPKTNIFRISIVACVIIIIGIGIYFISPKDTQQIKNFVKHWFSKSESNQLMYNELEKNVTDIGIENNAKADSAPVEHSIKVIKDYYGKYLNDSAIDDFIKYLTISRNLEEDYENYKVSKVEVEKGSNGYTFMAHLELTEGSKGKDVIISGKVQMKGKKINWIQLTDIGDF